jgi:hypothetical protein
VIDLLSDDFGGQHTIGSGEGQMTLRDVVKLRTNNDLAMEAASQALDPIGERIRLANGSTLETLNPALLAELQARDPRVRYAPADREFLQQGFAAGQPAYSQAVLRPLSDQVRADFPDVNVSVRGTVAALNKRYPFWDVGGRSDMSSDMSTVADILEHGSDNGSDSVRVGQVYEEDGELNADTAEWIYNHISVVSVEADPEDAAQTFPVLIVYEPSAFEAEPTHGWNTLTGEPSQRIAAIYITDKLT